MSVGPSSSANDDEAYLVNPPRVAPIVFQGVPQDLIVPAAQEEEHAMEPMGEVLRTMTFEFFGSGKHKISPADHLAAENALLLDVRSHEEVATLVFGLAHHMPILSIPIDEIPERLPEIPRDRAVGIFCSSGVRSAMVYLYLQARGWSNVRIVEGGYAELAEEVKPGKLLKHLRSRKEDTP